jgi:putative ABC transport system permease protein
MAFRFWRRLSYLWRQRQMDVDLAEELAFHREMKQRELEQSGMPAGDAEAASRRTLGNSTLARENARAVWISQGLDDLWRDVMYAICSMRRHPGFACVAITTLALGIGVTTAVFSLLYAVVLNPFPLIDADRFVSIRLLDKSASRPVFLTARQFMELRRSVVLEDAVATDIWPMTLTGQDLPEAINTQYFSANGLTVLGMRPLLGRVFTEHDGPPGQEPQRVVVLTHRFWQRHFGGRPDAIGQILRLNRQPYTVVGVLRPEHYETGPDIVVPLDLTFDADHAWSVGNAKLEPGVDRTLAAARLQPLFEQFAKEAPLRFPRDFRVELRSMLETRRTASFVPTLGLIAAAAVLLMLLACANVSILLLARGAAREQEFAVRAAIGASRAVLAKQLLVESLVLALVATALGVVTAYWSVPALLTWLPANSFPLVKPEVYVSLPVLVFSAGLAIVSGVIFGLAPTFSFSRPYLRPLTGISALHTTGSVKHRRTRALLLGTQVALTVVMLAGTGAAIRALVGLYQTSLGYDPRNVLAVTIDLPDGSHSDWGERAAFYQRVRENVQSIPQVQDVALTIYGGVPPRVGSRTQVEVPGKEVHGLSPMVHRISPAYFSTLKIPVLQGRVWTADEDARAAHVAVVSQAMASRIWPGTSPVGQKIRVPEFSQATSQFVLAAPGADGWFDIVGVAGDTPNVGLHAPPEPALYVPHAMMLGDSLTLIVRTARDPMTMTQSIREAVRAADPGQPVNRMRAAEEVLAQAGWARERFVTLLLLGFGAFALVLAAVGLYSVVSYSVSRRTKEFGIRTALGAGRAHIVGLALRPTIAPVAVGLAAGLALSAASNRIIARWFIGNLSDPLILVTINLVLLGVATLATLVPAHRAARIAPASALRTD